MFREYVGADKPCIFWRPRLRTATGAQRRAGAQCVWAAGSATAGIVAGAAAAVMVMVRVVMVIVVIAAGAAAAADAAALLDLLGAH